MVLVLPGKPIDKPWIQSWSTCWWKQTVKIHQTLHLTHWFSQPEHNHESSQLRFKSTSTHTTFIPSESWQSIHAEFVFKKTITVWSTSSSHSHTPVWTSPFTSTPAQDPPHHFYVFIQPICPSTSPFSNCTLSICFTCPLTRQSYKYTFCILSHFQLTSIWFEAKHYPKESSCFSIWKSSCFRARRWQSNWK